MYLCNSFVGLHSMQVYVITFPQFILINSSHGNTLDGRFYKKHVEFSLMLLTSGYVMIFLKYYQK